MTRSAGSASRLRSLPTHPRGSTGFRIVVRSAVTPTESTAGRCGDIASTPPAGYALEFNGQDSYVDLPTLRYDGSHPITLEATIVPSQRVQQGR